MGRPREEINPKQAIRFKQVLKEQKITAKDLAEQLFVTPNTLSKISTGKASLSNRIAGLINKLYPQYSVEWLLGLTDIANPVTEFFGTFKGIKEDWETVYSAVCQIAKTTACTITGSSSDIFENGVTIEDKDLIAHLSPEEVISLIMLIQETTSVQLKWYLFSKGTWKSETQEGGKKYDQKE